MLIVHLFLSYAHVNPCHSFSSSWCRGLAAASACGSTWTFLITFLLTIVKVTYKTLKKIYVSAAEVEQNHSTDFRVFRHVSFKKLFRRHFL